MQWSRITRKTVSLVGVRRKERGNEDAAGIIQPLLQTLLVSVNMMIPLIRPFWDVSMFKYSGLHHHASFTHTHTYKKCSTSVCRIQHIVFFSCFQSEPRTPDSAAASSVLLNGLQTHHINAATLKWPQLSHKLTAGVEVTHFHFFNASQIGNSRSRVRGIWRRGGHWGSFCAGCHGESANLSVTRNGHMLSHLAQRVKMIHKGHTAAKKLRRKKVNLIKVWILRTVFPHSSDFISQSPEDDESWCHAPLQPAMSTSISTVCTIL